MSKASKARKARAATKYPRDPLAQRRHYHSQWRHTRTRYMVPGMSWLEALYHDMVASGELPARDVHTEFANKVYGTPILAEVSEALEALDKLKEQQ